LTKGAVLALMAGGMVSALPAQIRGWDGKAPRMLVLTLRSTERNLGTQAAEQIRDRLSSTFSPTALYQVPRNEINEVLKASGYQQDEPLSQNDARELGRQLRAEQYVAGTVKKEGESFTVEAMMHLVRDPSLAQPLVSASATKMGDAARAVALEVRAARAQLEHEQRCVNFAREQKWAEAAQAAKDGIAAYPRATIARTCLLNVLVEQKAPEAEQLAMAEEILGLDSRARRALAIAGDIYRKQGKTDEMIRAYTGLIAADPTNSRLVEDVTKAIAGAGNPRVALPIIRKAAEDNPGDPALLRTRWLVELAAREYKAGLATGEEMVALDTAMADTSFFIRQAAAYAADSQPAKGAELLARGVQKFPDNAVLGVVYGQSLRTAGQTQQALEAIRKAIAMDPQVERGYASLAQLYVDGKQYDSAYAALMSAAKGTDSSFVGPLALAFGNVRQKEAGTSKAPADYASALQFLTLADQKAATTDGKLQALFLIGTTSVAYGQVQLNQAVQAKDCALLKQARDMIAEAQINIPKGARFAPQAAGQYLSVAGQLSAAGEQAAKAFKCP
jgi:tetratricopeptide (TPR) repeat protein